MNMFQPCRRDEVLPRCWIRRNEVLWDNQLSRSLPFAQNWSIVSKSLSWEPLISIVNVLIRNSDWFWFTFCRFSAMAETFLSAAVEPVVDSGTR